MRRGTTVNRWTARRWLVLVLLAVAATASAGCGKDRKNLPFGAGCNSDTDCKSDICLFADRASKRGQCTQPCDLDKNDCPTGTSCTTIAEHAGKSIPVCGEPPPIPFGPQGPPEGAGPPPGAPGAPPGMGTEPPPPIRPPPAAAPAAPATVAPAPAPQEPIR
jgi:hypothetical protein